jgi:FkbM family methyltransferase
MRIQTATEDQRLETRLTWLKRITGLSKYISKRRISRFCNRAFYLGKDPDSSFKLIAPYHRGLLMHIDTNSWMERWVLNQGYYEPEVIAFLEHCLRPGMVAFDVGANIGCHTLPMANVVGPKGRVFAFEPNPAIHQRLLANIGLNRLTQVEAVAACLSNDSDLQTLFAPLDNEYNQGLSSMHRGNLGQRCQEISVTALTLDDFVSEQNLDQIDLIKIDVEGHEFQVLTGARQVLQQFRPILIMEFSLQQWANAGVKPEQVEDYLAELGYKLFVLRETFITSIEHGLNEECNVIALPQPAVRRTRKTAEPVRQPLFSDPSVILPRRPVTLSGKDPQTTGQECDDPSRPTVS